MEYKKSKGEVPYEAENKIGNWDYLVSNISGINIYYSKNHTEIPRRIWLLRI